MTELYHYGIARKSGRYPWGSGEDPYQNNKSFLGQLKELKDSGMSEVAQSRAMGFESTNQLRAAITIATAEVRAADRATALKLKDKGYSNVAIGEKMGRNESSVRGLLDPALHERSQMVYTTADMLRENADKLRYVDVGVGVERHLGVSKTKLDKAIAILEEQGYQIHYSKVEQLGMPGQFTSLKVLTPPDVDSTEMWEKRGDIQSLVNYSEDGGRSFLGLEPIRSVDRSRIEVVYGEEGKLKDGVIELRRGVDDISLGQARYAQVRIGVDGESYMKGMAVYSDDLPDGIDIRYNTTKPLGAPDSSVFKPMKIDNTTGVVDADNPFGSIVRQKHYIDKDGKSQLSALNIMGYKDGAGEEGYWSDWSKSLSSQFLAKQSPALAEKQLGIAFDKKQQEYDEIMSLTNSAVKRRLLQPFADACDSDTYHLKAAALPRQGTHVILPLPGIKETEVYAPNYMNGDRVVLVRHPHGGIFEIPELIVNNKFPAGKKLLGQAKDAIGINPKTAEVLSGADFDGDTVLVIPSTARTGIKISAPLKGLKDFDPQTAYPGYEGMARMKKTSKGNYMGDISNLITDMTIKGANESELAAAVRHSMVVIDAEKHNLNFKQSYVDNGIAKLKTDYQGGANRGANTLISLASSTAYVNQRKVITNTKTMTDDELTLHKQGKVVYRDTGESYTNKQGKTVYNTARSKKMLETDDAFTLSSGTRMESIYATHANKLKALANQTRKDLINTPPSTYSADAKKTYASEVATLNAKLNISLKNAPAERNAQVLANNIVAQKKASNPDLDKSEVKKLRTMALNEARNRVGAKRVPVEITTREWEAIQAGAVSNSKLNQILNNTDLDKIKALATPRASQPAMTTAMETRAVSMMARGATQAEVASALGVSTSTISNIVTQ